MDFVDSNSLCDVSVNVSDPENSPKKKKRQHSLEKQLKIDFNPMFIAKELTPTSSRYGRARKSKTNIDFYTADEAIKISETAQKKTPPKNSPPKTPLKTSSPRQNIKNNVPKLNLDGNNSASKMSRKSKGSQNNSTEIKIPTHKNTTLPGVPYVKLKNLNKTHDETTKKVEKTVIEKAYLKPNSFANAFLQWSESRNQTNGDYLCKYLPQNLNQTSPKKNSHLSVLLERPSIDLPTDSKIDKSVELPTSVKPHAPKRGDKKVQSEIMKSTPKSKINKLQRNKSLEIIKKVIISPENVAEQAQLSLKPTPNLITKALTSEISLNQIERTSTYEIGDLAWARVGTYPFWPCLITNDPISGYFYKQKSYGRLTVKKDVLHVTFFADNERRGWVPCFMLKEFVGLAPFQQELESFTVQIKKKNPSYCNAFIISQKKQNIWNLAVTEAEALLLQPKLQRLEFFYPKQDTNTTPKRKTGPGVSRSLSESLFEGLFSEERNDKTLDVAEIVTKCLEDIVTKTGNDKIKEQSHMERWLLKAKSPHKDENLCIIGDGVVIKRIPKKKSIKDGKRFANSKNGVKKALTLNDFNIDSPETDSLSYSLSKNVRVSKKNALAIGLTRGINNKIDLEANKTDIRKTNRDNSNNKSINDDVDKISKKMNRGNNLATRKTDFDSTASEESFLDATSELLQQLTEFNTTKDNSINVNGNKILKTGRRSQAKMLPRKTELNSEAALDILVNETSTPLGKSELKRIEINSSIVPKVDVDKILKKATRNDTHFSLKNTESKSWGIEDSFFNGTTELNQQKTDLNTNKDDSSVESIKVGGAEVLKTVKTSRSNLATISVELNPVTSTDSFLNKISESSLKKIEFNEDVDNSRNDSKNLEINEIPKSGKRSRINVSMQKTEPDAGHGENIFPDKTSKPGWQNTANKNDSCIEVINVNADEISKNLTSSQSNLSMVKDELIIAHNQNIFSDETLKLSLRKTNEDKDNSSIESDTISNTVKRSQSNMSMRKTEFSSESTKGSFTNKLSLLKNTEFGTNQDYSSINSPNIKADEISNQMKRSKSNLSIKKKLSNLQSHENIVLDKTSELRKSESSINDNSRNKATKADVNKVPKRLTRNQSRLSLGKTELNSGETMSSCLQKPASNSSANKEVLLDIKSEKHASIEDLIAKNKSYARKIKVLVEPIKQDANIANGKSIVGQNNHCSETMQDSNDCISNKDRDQPFVKLIMQDFSTQLVAKINHDFQSILDDENIIQGAEIIQNGPKQEFLDITKISDMKMVESAIKTDEDDAKVEKSSQISLSDTISTKYKVENGKEANSYKDRLGNKFADGEALLLDDQTSDSENHLKVCSVLLNRIDLEKTSKPDDSNISVDNRICKKSVYIIKNNHSIKNIVYDLKNMDSKAVVVSDSHDAFVLSKITVDDGLRPTQKSELSLQNETDANVNIINEHVQTRQESNNFDEQQQNAVQKNATSTSKNVNLYQEKHRKTHRNEVNNAKDNEVKNIITNSTKEDTNASQTDFNRSLKTTHEAQDNVCESQDALSDEEVGSSNLETICYSPDSSSNLGNDTDTTKISTDLQSCLNEDKIYQIDEVSSSNDVIKNKIRMEIHKKYRNEEFQRYYGMNVDNLTDANPNLTEDQVMEYLYSAWKYAESQKSDEMKMIEARDNNLVKGIGEAIEMKPKKMKKTSKNKDIITMFFQKESGSNFEEKHLRNRSTRKYVDYSSDSDFDEKLSEIITRKNDNKVLSKSKLAESTVVKNESSIVGIERDLIIQIEDDLIDKNEKIKTESILLKDTVENSEVLDISTKPMNEEEQFEYLLECLKLPKANLFKGLAKEKVCEICEMPGNLVKCKGPCCGVFHIDCSVSKENEVEDHSDVKKRRRRKKVGRPKKPIEEKQSDSDKESCSSNSSEYQSNSMIVSLDEFELKAEQLMQEIMKETEPNYDSDISGNEIDWFNMAPGECEIVDIVIKKKQNTDNFICFNCAKYQKPLCFVCKSLIAPKSSSEVLQKCSVMHCNKYYHLECLDVWPQTQFNSSKKSADHLEALICPRHVCHTCVCDDPRGCKTRFSGDKLARCTRCPAVYHTFNQCVPAGTEILTASQVICPRHYNKKTRVGQHMNTSWCFICASGGSLICCDTCPTSFHANCLNISPPEGGYICEDCETGRLPLYGEIVWVKLGVYRWWPGIIVHPSDIPYNISLMTHYMSEFVVRFFPHNEHYWVHRGRVFPYQEGDKGSVSTRKTTVDSSFARAVAQAQKAYEIVRDLKKSTSIEPELTQSLLPPHYVKLKVNKPVGSVITATRALLEQADDDVTSSHCDCRKDDPSPCGMDSLCLNRMLLTECGPNCVTGDLCNNRAFEKRLYPKLVPYRTSWGGWGLKTLEDIKPGQFVIEYVGELIDEVEFKRRMRRKHEIRDENYYFLTLDKDRMIDAGPKGNVARFMNNSCDPNCETQKWTVLGDVRVGLFAIKHIPANSEVTFNYNLECASVEKKRCLCGAKCCSGFIGAKPKQLEAPPKTEKRKYIKKKQKEPRVRKPKVIIPPKPRELTEIEKDLMIIQNATNGLYDSDEDALRNGGNNQNGDVSHIGALDGVLTSQSESMTNLNSSLPSQVTTPSRAIKRKRFKFSPNSDGLLEELIDKKPKLSLGSSENKKRGRPKKSLNNSSFLSDLETIL